MGASGSVEQDAALYYAAAHGDEAELERHIAAACNVNHKASEAEEHGATPAIAAVQNDAIDCLQLLLACPSLEIDRSDSWGLTPVHHAARMHVGFDCRDHLHVNLSVRPRALHMLWVSE